MKKILLILISFVFLQSCAQTTALIGPAITIGSTGNVMQAGFSYGSNMMVRETTGKSTSEHVSSYVSNKKDERKTKKIQKEMVNYLENHILLMRARLSKKK